MMEAIPHIRFPLPVTLVCVTLTETNQDSSTGVPQWDFSYGEFPDEEWESPEVPKKGQNERTSKELFLTKLSPNTWTVLDKELFCVSVGPSLSAEVREPPPPPIWEWGKVVREQGHNSAWSFLAKLDSLKKYPSIWNLDMYGFYIFNI